MISGNHIFVCSIRCMQKVTKHLLPSTSPTVEATDSSRLLWHEDGPSESVNSLSVLVDWLTTEGNYARYRGSDDEGRTPAEGVIDKRGYCNMIAELMRRSGIRKPRTPDAIKNKIASIAGDWACAHDFLNRTGAGIEDEMTLHDAVKKRCALYYTLAPTFASQGNASGFTNESEDFTFRDLTTDDNDDGSVDDETDTTASTLDSFRTTASRISGTSRATVTPASGVAGAVSVAAETPQTENTRRRIEFLNVADVTTSTKKLRRGGTPDEPSLESKFFDQKIAFQEKKLEVDNGRLELEKKKDVRAAELFEMEKTEMRAKLMRDHFNMKKETQKYWLQAVNDGLYDSIEEAKRDYPLPPDPTFQFN